MMDVSNANFYVKLDVLIANMGYVMSVDEKVCIYRNKFSLIIINNYCKYEEEGWHF